MSRPTRSVQRLVQNKHAFSMEERFNSLDIRYPVCYRFVPKSEDDQICVCNRSRKRHETGTRNQPTGKVKLEKIENLEWDRKTHTALKQDEAHGRLVNGALYARLDITTDLETVNQLLFEVWQFPKPKLIMSIIGGGKYFALNDRLETNFINCIVNVAIRTDIWIITSGYNNGLMQLVGNAFHKARLRKPKQQITAIALCKWGSVKDPLHLIKREKNESTQRKKPDTSDTSDDEDEIEAQKNYKNNLNMKHTHYLMLDDAIHRHMDIGDFRTRLCNQIAYLDHERDFTPVVTVIVGGGDATITNIYNDLKSNIPVVIIDGSGSVADFFSRWLLRTKPFDKDFKERDIIYGIDEVVQISDQNEQETPSTRTGINPKVHQIVIDLNLNKLSNIFSTYKRHLENDLGKVLYRDDDFNMVELTNACEKVMYCLQASVRSNITVFNLNSGNDLSETIFRSISESYERLLKKKQSESDIISNKSKVNLEKQDKAVERSRLLELAMDWDCIDVAKEFALQNSLVDILDVEKSFKHAVQNNLHKFVYEFIKLGVKPAEIFFPANGFANDLHRYDQFIREFYADEIVKKAPTQLQLFLDADKCFDGVLNTTDKLNFILHTLIGDYMHKLYFDSFKSEDEDRKKSGLTTTSIEIRQNRSKDYESIKSLTAEEQSEMARDYIMRDLFLWSILMNYIDMAKVFLSHMKYRICPALIATKILKKYHHKATYGQSKDDYLNSATYFQQYAIDCIEKCNDHDADKACEIVLERNELYGYVTCLQVAADAKDELFIATPCCVQAMKNVWYDKIYPEQTIRNHLAMFFGFITFGLSAPVSVPYREYQHEEAGVTSKATFRSCGINYSDAYRLEHPRYIKRNLEMNRYVHRLKNFHQSLVMKFLHHVITYFFFVLLFSYVLLFNFNPPTDQTPSIHWTEILTILLVSSMLIEETRYFFAQDSLTFRGKVANFFRDMFKPMTLIAFILFYIGLIVRFTYADSEVNFTAARVIMAIDIELWWLRLLSFIIVIQFLGPQLVAITKMLKDLLFFICIIAIAMIGYGVASRSMVYYPIVNNFTTATGGFIDTSFDGRDVFRQILYPVYYFLHGDLDSELENLDSNPNAGWSIATEVLLAGQMLFVNILLANLLIAIFNKRYDQVYNDTWNIWHSQQYLFTREYYSRSPFFPPISLIYDIYYLCRMFYFFIRRKISDGSADRKFKVFKMIPKDKSHIRDRYEFEGASTYQYAHDEVKASKKSSSEQDSSNTEKKQDKINKQKNSDNALDVLRLVQEDVAKLNVSIEGMKGDINNNHPK